MKVEICRRCKTSPRLSVSSGEYQLMCDCGVLFCAPCLERVVIGWNIIVSLKDVQ